MIRKKIINLIQKSIRKLQKEKAFPDFEIPEIQTECPAEKVHGDYSTNVAMILAKIVKKNPMEIAAYLTKELKNRKTEKLFEKIEATKPGFINFFLSKEYLQKQVEEVLKQSEKFGQLNIGKKIKTQVEFISANPTGQLHIGNGRGAFFGDTLANILEGAGYKITREYYINDAKVNTQIKTLGQTALGEGDTYLNDYLKEKISKVKSQIAKLQLKTQNLEGEAGYILAREAQRDIKSFIEKKLKIKFDNWVSEGNLYKKNRVKKIYNWLKSKNLVYKKEEAEWLKISEYGAPKDEVIVRQTGEPTYFLSDIAYHKDKFDRGFKKIINIWGADHQGHVPKIKAVAKILGYTRQFRVAKRVGREGQLDILISQIVRLKGGIKISKRKGEIITLEELIDEIGLDVARFFYLTKSLNTQMEIDLKLAKEQSEKNPVYYVQYAHARICSILRKKELSSLRSLRSLAPYEKLNHPSELALIKQLIRFPEIIEDTAKDYQVQRVPQYAIDLATSFHQFYRDCKVLTEVRPLTSARLGLILATKIVLKNTLNLMGVSAPERM